MRVIKERELEKEKERALVQRFTKGERGECWSPVSAITLNDISCLLMQYYNNVDKLGAYSSTTG